MPLPNGGGLQADNVLAEYNIPPAASADQFDTNVFNTHWLVEEYLNKLGMYSKYNPSGYFEQDQLQHPDAFAVGCSVDYNAYTKSINPKPKFKQEGFRTCGGHVHFSWEEEIPSNPRQASKFDKYLHERISKIIRQLDLYLGVPSLLLDLDNERRRLYGKAGSYRIKCYGPNIIGGEYRTLSNFWADPKYMGKYNKWVFNTTEFVFNNIDNLEEVLDTSNIINSYDIKTATSLIKDLQLMDGI